MDLKESHPTVFNHYLDNPLLLDQLVQAAILLDKEQMLLDTLNELAKTSTYLTVTTDIDRFALWLFNIGAVDPTAIVDRPPVDRAINPIAAENPTTILGTLRILERLVLRRSIQDAVNEALGKELREFFALFNLTRLQ